MQQRGVFDSTPGLHCEVYCFHASAFTLWKEKGRKSRRCENSGHGVIDVRYNVRAPIKQHLIIQSPNELQKQKTVNTNCSFFSCLDCSSQRVDQVNDPRPVLAYTGHYSPCLITVQHLAIRGSLLLSLRRWISLFWQCLRGGTLCEVSGEDYMWQIWRGNQEKTNRQLNAWEMSRRSDRRR